jgi:hypothetical protein
MSQFMQPINVPWLNSQTHNTSNKCSLLAFFSDMNQMKSQPHANLNSIQQTLVPQPIFHAVNTSINFLCTFLPIVILHRYCVSLYQMRIHQYTHKYSTCCRQKPILASMFLLEVLYCIGTESDIDMDKSYTRVLHIKVAYRISHKWRHAFYFTQQQLCVRITCYVTVITVEINHCSFRSVRFALLYIVTRSKIV